MKPITRRTMLLSLLGCVPLMGLLVLPVMVGGFVDYLGLSERDSGLLSSASFLGASLAALVLAFRIHHMDLRRLATLGLVFMLVADCLSIAAASLPMVVLVSLRFVSGAASAGVYGAVMTAFAGFREPDRAYGMFMAIQFGISALGLFLLPWLMPSIGVEGLFILFAAFDAVGLLLLRQLPDSNDRAPRLAGARLEWQIIFTLTALLCLLAYGLFETAQMGQFAYIERIGVALELGTGQVGLSLGLASLIGIPAAFSVTWLGSRFGYFRPIAAAATVQILAMVWLIYAKSFTEFLIITSLFSAGWAFVLPYFQAIEARIDPGGSVVVAGSFATGTAGFLGPAGAAFLVRPGDYSLMLHGIIVCIAVVVILTRIVTRRLAIDPRSEV